MKNQINAIINFAYFTANFPRNFIEDCWEDEPYLIDHITSKFRGQSEGQVVYSGGFIKFFLDLDRENQTKLANWINENYVSFNNLK